ncbi:transcriptional regulator [uncultured Mediterranean phage uvMED]|nr:transcriptional regulator [uncultured Mediterranean phage uvMED]|tara:strand:- start:290 stop:628 length:339 start_codon:yes stop_codon:yes gene_type:complete
MSWVELTDTDAERLVSAITRSKNFANKMAIFQTGFIAPKHRWLQTSAHDLYDVLSKRERQVFAMRIQQHTFPIIAEALQISESTAKTYWLRTMTKCSKLFMSSNHSIDDEEE